MDNTATIADSEGATVETATPKRKGRPAGMRNGAAHKRIIEIAKKHPDAPKREIARRAGVDKATVDRALVKYGIRQADVAVYVDNRAAIFQGMQSRLLTSITDEDIAKMSGKDRMIGLGVLYDKERLETGQSTANVASLTALVTGAARFDKPTERDAVPKDVAK